MNSALFMLGRGNISGPLTALHLYDLVVFLVFLQHLWNVWIYVFLQLPTNCDMLPVVLHTRYSVVAASLLLMTFIRTKQDVWQPFHKPQQQSHMIRKAQKTASLGIQVTCVIVCFWSWDLFIPLKGSTEPPGKVSQLRSYKPFVSGLHLQYVQSCHLVLTSTGSGEHDLKTTWHMFFLPRLKMQISKNT